MTDEKKFYATTAIPYVNAAPHIGHALEFVQTDVVSRYHSRLLGEDTFVLTGSDENSLKNVKAAEELKIDTRTLVDRNAKLFKELAEKIDLGFNGFLKSSVQEDHWPGVHKLWSLVEKSGDIYKKKYKGLYCVACEAFYKESELEDGLDPVHHRKPEVVEEENYFFKLSKYQSKLEKLIETEQLRILPESRKHEVLSFVKMGLEDFSISRSVARSKGWGVPVPNDPSQILYVWMDALTIYLTGIGYGTEERKFKKWWPADVHFIGKDIIRFHAVYWPAFLLSAGLPLPRNLFVHGFLTVEGQKMSKTTGNVIDPMALLKKYSPDELRYYLIRDIPTFQDGDFSEKALKDRINKELLGDLGNLVNRVLTIAEKTGRGEFSGSLELEGKLRLEDFKRQMQEMDLHEALGTVMEFVRECNRYVNEKAPWKLEGKELEQVLYNLLEALRIISILMYPFTPKTSESIAEKLGTKVGGIDGCAFRKKFSEKTNKGGLLFKKVE